MLHEIHNGARTPKTAILTANIDKILTNTSEAGSHRRCSVKHLCWSLFLIKLQSWRHGNLSKKDSNIGVFPWNLLNFKGTYFEEHLLTTAPDTSRGVIELFELLIELLLLLNFLKIFYSGQYTMLIHHEQCIFIYMTQSGRERNNFQQLSKLIELKFISTTWPH